MLLSTASSCLALHLLTACTVGFLVLSGGCLVGHYSDGSRCMATVPHGGKEVVLVAVTLEERRRRATSFNVGGPICCSF
ncbi:hypothetical protein DVH24_015640 [Malus domestica]|uniref:Secreted protein n=1 Tax=Malus domestica TaxID=3750 RepID=A0A498HHN2_MALDO|nr:hypothetical protein DVH24_015640 [Malus domestica]